MDRSVIKISIIEDHAIVRAGLRMLLENRPGLEVVGEAANVSEALAHDVLPPPDVIILDLELGQQNGLDFVAELLDRFYPARVLILTATTDIQVHLRAVTAGASGIVIKEQAPETLLKAIHGIHSGETWLSRSVMSAALGQIQRPRAEAESKNPETAKMALLTPREREVVQLISEGLRGDRIASQLKISEGTVRNHLTSILGKLGLSNRFELAVYAFRHGLGSVPLAGTNPG